MNCVARCRELAAITDVPGSTTRTFLSPAMHTVNERVGRWLSEAGAEVTIDAAGNLRGVKRGASDRTLIIGSHLDTVPNAGAFDGVLGVVLGVAILERLRNVSLPFSICVVGFSEEEGVRFGVPFIGSRALVGTLDDAVLDTRDAGGTSIRSALGTDVTKAKLTNAFAYLEIHIEQGPVLDSLELPLGVVDAIVGQSRWLLRFDGRANHAGTTPMNLRADALAAAAAWVSAVETTARTTQGLVATVGRLEVRPNAGNVIAGEVTASLDVRHANDATRWQTTEHLLDAAHHSADSRGVKVSREERLDQPAAPMHAELRNLLATAVQSRGLPVHTLPSGAGHDAMIIAPHVPSAMLFVRSPGGVSHHPNESVIENDVELALETGVAFVDLLSRGNLHV